MDLHIPLACDGTAADSSSLSERLSTLQVLGYNTIGLVHRPAVTGRLTDTDKCRAFHHISAPSRGAAAQAQLSCANCLAPVLGRGISAQASVDPSSMCLLSRLSVTASEPAHIQAIASATAVTAMYDLVSVVPQSDKVMHQACHWLDVEIISLDLGQKLPFRLRPKLLAAATARGVMFEVCYSGAMHDSPSRQMLISNVQALVRALNGRGLILSSGACSALELRSTAAATALLAVMAGHACSRVTSSTSSMTSLHSSIACNARTAIARGQARKDSSQLKLHQLQLQQPQLGVQGGETLLKPPQFLPLSDVPHAHPACKKGSARRGGVPGNGDGVLEEGGVEQNAGQGLQKRPRKRGGRGKKKVRLPVLDGG